MAGGRRDEEETGAVRGKVGDGGSMNEQEGGCGQPWPFHQNDEIRPLATVPSHMCLAGDKMALTAC